MAKGQVAITVERCKGLRILCRILPHPRSGALIRFQFKGLPSAPRRRRRESAAAATSAECTVPTSPSSELAMHADPKGVLTGVHFLDGDHACCEGTLAAGARFAAGYPITPSTEVVERFAWRIPTVGGIFIQMEDELAASIAIQGAVWGGAKAFTVTSGPGFSLMMEHIGYAAMTETPCVFVNVQRGGPSTGLPTLPAQADMMQAKWGSHGDYSIIALCPNSPQECFDLTITGFNLAEEFRVPVMMMLDECVGHMTEKVVIPDSRPDRHHAAPLHQTAARRVPPLRAAGRPGPRHGEGRRRLPLPRHRPDPRRARLPQHERRDAGPPGAPPAGQAEAVRQRPRALRSRRSWTTPKSWWSPTASRRGSPSAPLQLARAQGIRAGKFRIISAWPFPEQHIRELAGRVKAFVVPELNLGQMVHEVERCAAGRAKVVSVPHAGGSVHKPEVILKAILEAAR